MPPRRKAQQAAPVNSTLLSMLDSASEDEFARDNEATMLTPDSSLENAAPAGATRGRRATTRAKTAASTAMKTKARAGRRASGASVLGRKGGAVGKRGSRRTVLAEKSANANASETEEVENFDAEGEDLAPAPAPVKPKRGRPGRPPKVKAEERAGESNGTDDKEKAPAVEEKPGIPEQTKKRNVRATGRGKRAEAALEVEQQKVVPETQPDPMEVEPSVVIGNVDLAPESNVRNSSRVRSVSRQRPNLPSIQRARSASDTERAGSDPVLRRKLGDMTKKFESLDLKYQQMKQIGIRDGESNFDRLKRTTDERAKAQDALIASLKAEIATQRALAAESKSLRSQLQTLQTSHANLALENKTLQASLTAAQNEIRSLSTKLAQTRTTQQEVAKVPGSAVKARPTPGHATHGGGGGSSKDSEAQAWKLKEELYTDLTGLIIRNVKRGEDQDIYDCIQTGRNGTLHFHLSISAPKATSSASAGPSGGTTRNAYDDAEFAYTPLLDESRDRDLISILPDYLAEEICFPRSSAAKFYAKVGECMMKKVIIEDEDDEED